MWEDYIHFHHPDFRKTIYVRRLIAFFPVEGYIIFEGYNRVLKSELPFRTDIYRVQPNTEFAAYFKTEIIEMYKKDIAEQPSKKKPILDNCETGDNYEGCISFFPLDIIILKFRVLESDNKYPFISWNFSVDNRFLSPNALIDKYLSLLELPEDSYESYTPVEDDDFYEEYHTIMDKYENIYLNEFIGSDLYC